MPSASLQGPQRPVQGPATFGLPSDMSFVRFLVEHDIQRRIRDDKSMESRLVKREEV